MIDKIRSHQLFRPDIKLKQKYRLRVILGVFVFWLLPSSYLVLRYGLEDGPIQGFILGLFKFTVITSIIAITLTYVFSLWYYNSISYEIVSDEVHVFRGIITKTRKIVPYRTITNFDIKQGPFDRILKLGTIEIQTAGNSPNKLGPEERIDGLPIEYLEEIQTFLIDKVRKVRGSAATSHDLDTEESILSSILHEVRLLRQNLNEKSSK